MSGAPAAPAPGGARLPEIDRVKGFAIACVLLIHARPLVDLAIHDLLVNRAVPVLVCLFGMTSTLWWQRQGAERFGAVTRRWLLTRAARLMIPVWGMLALWWPMQLVLWDAALHEPRFVVATLLGYMPWVGAGWFVTLVVELVVLFPFLRWAYVRLGPAPSLLVALGITLLAHRHHLAIIAVLRVVLLESAPFEPFFYFWIFAPAYLWAICGGMALAGRWPAAARRLAALALPAFVAATLAHRLLPEDPYVRTGLTALADVPLTILLLYAATMVSARSLADRALTWLGVHSWGIYVGHLVVLNWFWLREWQPEEGPLWGRALYTVVLLAGAAVLLRLGTAALDALRRATKSA